MSGTSLGSAILELKTNQAPLRQGLTEARAETIRQTAQIQNAARIELRANLLRLQSDYQQAQRLARDNAARTARESQFELRANLAKFQSDLRQAENEQKASLKRMQQQASQSGGLLGDIGQGVLSGIGFGGAAATTAAGVQAVTGAIRSGVGTVVDYNAAVEAAQSRILGFTRSQAEVARTTALANAEVARGRGGFQETLDALADLTPLARTYNANLLDVLHTAQLLAATDPAQGFSGAAVALREALSGDFVSLVRRFEIPRSEIAKLKAEGVPNLEIVQRALSRLGIDDSLLVQQAQTFNQQLKIAADTAQRFVAGAGKPLFDGLKQDLGAAIAFLNSPEVQQAGKDFAAGLAASLAAVRATLTDPATIAGLAAVTGTTAAGGLRIFGTLAKDLADLERSIDHTDKIARVLIAALTGGLPGTVFALASEDVRHLGDAINDPRLQKGLDDLLAKITRAIDGAKILDLNPNRVPTPPPPAGNQVQPPFRPDQADRGLAPTVVQPPARPDQADRTAQANASRIALYQQGVADIRAYLDGFSSQDFDLFGKLKPQIEASFRRAFADLDADQLAGGLLKIDGLTARITKDIDTIGHVSGQTQAAIRGVFGGAADEVIALADAYGRAAQAGNAYTAAALAAAVANGQLAAVTATANAHIKAAEDALTAAKRAASANQAQFQNQVAELQRALSAIEREAQQVARAYDDTLRGLQSALAASQRAGEEAQRQFAAQVAAIQRAGAEAQKQFQQQIEAAQKEQEAIQRAAQQHSEAFAAVLDNTTDEFLANKAAENEALDEQTKRILGLGQAYQEYARQATAADHAVRQADEQEAQTRLDFDRRIQAARNAGNESAARALERERDRVLARQRQNSQVTRDEAVVAGQKAQDARDPLEQERRRVAEQDKINGDAADKRVKEIQDQAKARAQADQDAIDAIQEQAKERAEADRLAQQAIQDRIDQTQEEARAAAQMYADRKQGVQDEIDKVNERARQQKIADDAAILAAQQTLDLVKSIEDKRIDAARQGARNAQDAANAAKAEYDAQLLALDAMNKRNSALDTYIQKWKDFIEYLKGQNIPVPQFFGAPSQQPQNPKPGGGVTEGGGTGAPESPPPAPSGPGFFGMVMAPTSTAPAAPTSYYRAPVPPAPNAASYTAGLAAASLAPAPNGATQVHYHFAGDWMHIDHVDATSEADIDLLTARVRQQQVDEEINAFDITRRGQVASGRRFGQ
jgi:RecA/RadA recombinase